MAATNEKELDAIERFKQKRQARQALQQAASADEDVQLEVSLYKRILRAYELLWNPDSPDYVDPDSEKWQAGWKNMNRWMLKYEPLVLKLFDISRLRAERICSCGQPIVVAWMSVCRNCEHGTEPLSASWTDGSYIYSLKQKKTGNWVAVWKSIRGGLERPLPDWIETPDRDKAIKWLSEIGRRNQWEAQGWFTSG